MCFSFIYLNEQSHSGFHSMKAVLFSITNKLTYIVRVLWRASQRNGDWSGLRRCSCSQSVVCLQLQSHAICWFSIISPLSACYSMIMCHYMSEFTTASFKTKLLSRMLKQKDASMRHELKRIHSAWECLIFLWLSMFAGWMENCEMFYDIYY